MQNTNRILLKPSGAILQLAMTGQALSCGLENFRLRTVVLRFNRTDGPF